jgi:adenine specific DNA methylase Mod
MARSTDNVLYCGDNLNILGKYVEDESVDLVYLDPPFNSNQDYNVLFEERDGSLAASQIKAFEDTWRWDTAAAAAYQEAVERTDYPDVARSMQAFRLALGETDMLAYLSMMAPRLIELRRTLKPTGSLYLHCDPRASHYLKALLDGIFGPTHFWNEIIWKRTSGHSDARRYGRVHDVLPSTRRATNRSGTRRTSPMTRRTSGSTTATRILTDASSCQATSRQLA